MRMRWTMGVGLLFAVGCSNAPENPCPDAPDAEVSRTVGFWNSVDLLFVVDDSNSMAQEQASLAAAVEPLVRGLATGDVDGDGRADGPDDMVPIQDLQVGVISTDMGVGGFTVPTCERADFGDDGVLRTQGRTDMAGCAATYPSFLNFQPSFGLDLGRFASDVACVSTIGTRGCAFEQPLEATLKALSPSAPTFWTEDGFVPPVFFRGTYGHADGANSGFVRHDSILVVVPLTDEDDCSVLDPSLHDPSSRVYGDTDLNLRCFAHGDALQSVSRYVEGLLQLRRDPGRLVYAPIVGVPVDLAQRFDASGGLEPVDWERLVGAADGTRDERMVERVDPTMPNRLVPSCDEPGRGIAFPPVRMVRVARELEARGARVTVQSICQESLASAVRAILRRVASSADMTCFQRTLTRRADGTVPCELRAVMPEGAACADLAGASPRLDDAGAPIMEGGRAVCVVAQLPVDGSAPEGEGWYYDDFSEEASRCGDGARLEITHPLPPVAGLELACALATGGPDAFGDPCEPLPDGAPDACDGWREDAWLSCDPAWGTCGVPCRSYRDCESAGLPGWSCDDRSLRELNPSLTSDEPHSFCVDPACG